MWKYIWVLLTQKNHLRVYRNVHTPCCGLNCVSLPIPNKICWSLNSQYWIGVYLKIKYSSNQFKMRPTGWDLFQYNSCPYKKEKSVHTNRHAQREVRVQTKGKFHVKMESWRDVSTNLGTLWGYQNLGQRQMVPSLAPSEGTWLCWHLHCADVASSTETINFCHSKPPSFCYGCLGNQCIPYMYYKKLKMYLLCHFGTHKFNSTHYAEEWKIQQKQQHSLKCWLTGN